MTMRRAIGLMSGTSMDGVDAALLETDGERIVRAGPGLSTPYPPELRRALQALLGAQKASPESAAAADAVTEAHIQAVENLLAHLGRDAGEIDVIGFHGQTLFHQPPSGGRAGWTWQLGDGRAMADRLGIPVVFDFRDADMAAGGQGAPFAPVYHRALAASIDAFPVAFLNVGGVSNLTFLTDADAPPIGFDTGPGNAPIDDLVQRRTGAGFDENGALARAGRVDEGALAVMLNHSYFEAPYPKSLDRNAFDVAAVEGLSTEDAAATLAAFAAEAVAQGAAMLPDRPRAWYVTGGGRRNPVIMAALEARLDAPVAPVEAIGTDGDLLEAQAFAYMAVRRLKNLPISFPETTGCAAPMLGGRLAAPKTPVTIR